MPNTTKRLISDQVLFRLYGSLPDSSATVQKYDVYKALEQKINAKFKLTQFSQTLPNGQTIPDNLMIATYEDVPVTRTFNEQSVATLPVMPISLPIGMGINEIRPVLNQIPTGDRMLGSPMIPLQAGQDFLLQADKLLNGLMGQVGYTPSQSKVIFTTDLTTLNVTKVDMKLVVFDLSQYGETDPLPIPSDMEEILVSELYAQFAPVQPERGIINPITTFGDQAPSQPIEQ